MSFVLLWLRGFGLTLVVEEAIGIPLLASTEQSFSRRAMAILVANLATHPLVWFFFSRLGLPRATFMVVAETWAFGFEVLAYRTIFPSASWKRCSLVSISANSASFLLGLLAIEWGFFRT